MRAVTTTTTIDAATSVPYTGFCDVTLACEPRAAKGAAAGGGRAEAVCRRRLGLRLLGAGAAVWLLGGHSPYRQWDVYRKVRLVVLVGARDEASARLAPALVAILAQQLPESRATVARARDSNDLVRLIASRQLEVALMREGDAYAAFTGAAPFADNGRVALRTLAALGEHLLVCVEEVPRAAAYLLVEALADRWRNIDPVLVRHATSPRPPPALRVPLHAGAAEFYREHG